MKNSFLWYHVGGGAGDLASGNGAPVGRGAMRGRRQVNVDIVRTRPVNLNSKQGGFFSTCDTF